MRVSNVTDNIIKYGEKAYDPKNPYYLFSDWYAFYSSENIELINVIEPDKILDSSQNDRDALYYSGGTRGGSAIGNSRQISYYDFRGLEELFTGNPQMTYTLSANNDAALTEWSMWITAIWFNSTNSVVNIYMPSIGIVSGASGNDYGYYLTSNNKIYLTTSAGNTEKYTVSASFSTAGSASSLPSKPLLFIWEKDATSERLWYLNDTLDDPVITNTIDPPDINNHLSPHGRGVDTLSVSHIGVRDSVSTADERQAWYNWTTGRFEIET